MKKIPVVFLIFAFLNSLISPLYAYTQIPVYLCEIGIKFYSQGRYAEALHEFNKALIVKPDYTPALEYIEKIRQETGLKPEERIIPSVTVTPETRALISPALPGVIVPLTVIPVKPELPKELLPPEVLVLDENLKLITQPIEIEQGKSMVVVGKNIQRFLVTQPDILIIERKSSDELLVTGKSLGYTYMHIWDDNGRWTTEWLCVFPKPEGPTYEELMRLKEERARNFKLSYTMDWYSYETGRRMKTLKRSSYSWGHGLSLTGETPYGDLDSLVNIRSVKTTTDLTYFTLGLTNGKFGPFKDFELRLFDYSPNFSNLVFPGATLRGVMFDSPAFNKKIYYTAFWGREGGGRYGNLSPGLAKTQHSFLNGFNLSYLPTREQVYEFSLLHGWGRNRENFLNHYGYDLSANWNFYKWGLGYEIAQDSEEFANLLTIHYNQPKLNLSAELRDVNKNFVSITDRGWRAGERGGLFNLSYNPTEKLGMYTSLDIYQDRLFPAEDNANRWNEDFNWNTSYRFNPLTSLNLNYTLQNDLGRLSQYRYESSSLTLSHRLKLLRDIYTFINYYHQKNRSFSSPASDYINDRVYVGQDLV